MNTPGGSPAPRGRRAEFQDLAAVEYRELRVVWAAFGLIDAPGEQGGFFSHGVDEDKHHLLGVPGMQVTRPCFGAEMPGGAAIPVRGSAVIGPS